MQGSVVVCNQKEMVNKKTISDDKLNHNTIIIKGVFKMSSEVKNFIRKIVFTVIAFAALCLFCFDMFGSSSSHIGFLALLFPFLGMLEFILPTPDFTK